MALLSSQLKSRMRETDSLLSALDAISNLRAFALLAVTFIVLAIALVVLFGVAAWIATKSVGLGAFLGLLAGLVCYAIVLVGGNAAGILLMDEACGRAPRSAMGALLASLFTSHRLVLILLIEFLLFVLYLLLLAIVLLLCKVPGIGPFLYSIVFPLASILTGVVLFSLVYVALPLAAPAVWNGSTVTQTIAMLGLVARQRLIFVVIMEILLALLTALVGGLIAIVLVGGVSTVLGLSAAIIGMDSIGRDFMSLFQGFFGGRTSGSGYGLALGFGGAVLFFCGAIPPLLVLMKGSAIMYLNASSGLAIADAEAQMKNAVDGLKAKAQDARDRAVAAGAAAGSASPVSSMSPAPVQAPMRVAPACPACHAAITAEDVFCGNCGHKLS